jgi:ABC-2 type transport system permease protein
MCWRDDGRALIMASYLASTSGLFFAEVRKNLLVWLRYPLQPAAGLLALFAMFFALSFGLRKLPGLEVFSHGDPRVIVASFFCWVCAMGSIGHIASELEEDAKIGVLETLFLSRLRSCEIILVRSLASSVSGLALSFAVLWLLSWYSGAGLALGLDAILALVLLDLALSGLGLVMAGLSIVFKRVSSLAPLLYLAAGTLLASTISLVPSDQRLRYPVVSAVEVFSRTVFDTGLPWPLVAVAAGWAVVTLLACAVFLECCTGYARRRGSLSHY